MKKNAIVTGVASGIGKVIGEKLWEHGYDVYGLDIDTIYTDYIKSYICDISKENEVINIVNQIIDKIGNVDILINAAGIFCCEDCYDIQSTPFSDWKKIIDTNLNGTFLVSKFVMPYLVEGGVVINFSSEQTINPGMKNSPYIVSKAGIEMFSKLLAKELMPKRIRVNTIALSSVKTNFIRHLVESDAAFEDIMKTTATQTPLGLITTQDVWKLVWYLFSEGNKMTGQTIFLESGTTL